MQSLTKHLLHPDDHGRLAFHPDCPVCRRDRLAGALASEPVVSRRVQALLAAGVLSLSASTPTVAVAVEQDLEQEGAALPETEVNRTGDGGPEFDPGGVTTDLPADAPELPQIQAPAESGAPDDGALEQEPPTDIPTEATDESAPPIDAEAQAPPSPQQETPAPAPPQILAPPQPPPQEPAAPAAAPPATPTSAPQREARRPRGRREAEKRPPRVRAIPDVVRSDVSPRAAKSVPPVTVAQSPVASAAAAPTADRNGGRGIHVVRAGESLWSIAAGLLGAGASPAEIARKVDRLWRLNAERIATGQPDLILPGTRLRTR